MSESKTATKKVESGPSAEEKAAAEREKKINRRECVVDDDFHVGRAVNGLVCSYHAMHYLADGTPRAQ